LPSIAANTHIDAIAVKGLVTEGCCRAWAIIATAWNAAADIAIALAAGGATLVTAAIMATAMTAMMATSRPTPVRGGTLSHDFVLFCSSFTLLSRVSKLGAHRRYNSKQMNQNR